MGRPTPTARKAAEPRKSRRLTVSAVKKTPVAAIKKPPAKATKKMPVALKPIAKAAAMVVIRMQYGYGEDYSYESQYYDSMKLANEEVMAQWNMVESERFQSMELYKNKAGFLKCCMLERREGQEMTVEAQSVVDRLAWELIATDNDDTIDEAHEKTDGHSTFHWLF